MQRVRLPMRKAGGGREPNQTPQQANLGGGAAAGGGAGAGWAGPGASIRCGRAVGQLARGGPQEARGSEEGVGHGSCCPGGAARQWGVSMGPGVSAESWRPSPRPRSQELSTGRSPAVQGSPAGPAPIRCPTRCHHDQSRGSRPGDGRGEAGKPIMGRAWHVPGGAGAHPALRACHRMWRRTLTTT